MSRSKKQTRNFDAKTLRNPARRSFLKNLGRGALALGALAYGGSLLLPSTALAKSDSNYAKKPYIEVAKLLKEFEKNYAKYEVSRNLNDTDFIGAFDMLISPRLRLKRWNVSLSSGGACIITDDQSKLVKLTKDVSKDLTGWKKVRIFEIPRGREQSGIVFDGGPKEDTILIVATPKEALFIFYDVSKKENKLCIAKVDYGKVTNGKRPEVAIDLGKNFEFYFVGPNPGKGKLAVRSTFVGPSDGGSVKASYCQLV